jgi:hypothetical protein
MMWIIQLLVCIYLVSIAIRMIQLQSYTSDINVFYETSYDGFIKHVKGATPTLLYNKNYQLPPIDFKENIIQAGGEIVSLSSYKDKQTSLFLYKDKSIDLKTPPIPLTDVYDSKLLLTPESSFNVIRGEHITSVQKNTYNYMFLETLDGYSVIYMIHPKFKNELNNYKENGYKLILQPKTILYIPTNWYYIQEINENVVQKNTLVNDIFLCVPNSVKKYITIV